MAKLRGAAKSAKSAPVVCKTALSRCMKGRGGRSKARGCMIDFNRCKERR
jgi:hypothetical protein